MLKTNQKFIPAFANKNFWDVETVLDKQINSLEEYGLSVNIRPKALVMSLEVQKNMPYQTWKH